MTDSQAPLAAASTRHGPGPALAVLMAATFIFVLDFFIVNVAIPSTQRDLAASAGEIQLIVAGYAIALASGLIVGGRLGDLIGRRRALMCGLTLFTVASAVCGVAGSPTVLIGGRIAQGLGAALFSPQILAIIGVTYQGEERTRAITLYGLVLGLGAVTGQLIGGLLIHFDVLGLDWRSCYLVNVPVGAAAVALAPRVVPESRAELRDRLDAGSAALIAAALVAVVLPLVEGRQDGWPPWTWASLAAAAPLLLAFALRQRRLAERGGSPLVPPALFGRRAFTVGLLGTIAFYAGMASFFFVLAVYLQQGRGLDALGSGLTFTPLAIGYLAASIASPKLVSRLGRQALALGGIIRAVALAGLALTVAAIGVGGDTAALVPALLVDGVGMGLLTAPLVSTVLAGMQARDAGAATGVLSTAQQVGNTIGVAVIGAVFYGALGPAADFSHAFLTATLAILGVAVGVAALVQLLPSGPGAREATVPSAEPAAVAS
jgi:EmrB/QacA subfamily drug resistance transporter